MRLWVSRVSSGCGTRYTSARNDSLLKVLLWPVRDTCIVVGSLERVLRETPKFPKPLFEVLGKTTNFEHSSQSWNDALLAGSYSELVDRVATMTGPGYVHRWAGLQQ